jgi:hypothetical protein
VTERTLKSLNRLGLEELRTYLARLRDGRDEAPPFALLDDPAYIKELPVELEVGVPLFTSRFELGRYLTELLEPLRADVTDRDIGLWAWLSLAWFDQVCPIDEAGKRQPGRDYRHIPDFSFRNKHRHLLLGPFQLYRRHGTSAALLLAGSLNSESGVYHEIASRQDLVANRGVLEAAQQLYLDAKRGRPKPGAQGSINQPGTVRRFVRVLQQLDVTYDIYGLTAKQILELLPPEFDDWRARQALDLATTTRKPKQEPSLRPPSP